MLELTREEISALLDGIGRPEDLGTEEMDMLEAANPELASAITKLAYEEQLRG